MSIRQILVSVWQGRCVKVDDFLFLVDKFDFEVVVGILRDLNDKIITINEAEEDLKTGRFARH